MSESKAFASLSPTLLARKGGAKPAMRPQLHPIHQFTEATARQLEDDLGWNDHGDDVDHPAEQAADPVSPEEFTAQVVSLNGTDLSGVDVPEVVRQREAIARSVEQIAPRHRSAQGRRVAFTLRLDPERHLKLRLACTISNHSAQQIVTEALDRLIDGMPEIEALAARIEERSR